MIINRWQSSKMACTHKLCRHSLVTIPWRVNTQFSVSPFTHKWMPEPYHCTPCHILLNRIQPYTVIWIAMTRTDGTNNLDLVGQAKKANVKSPQQYENITYKFIACRMQSSILFCCTETNNILRAVSSSADAVFSMRTFTWFWCLWVSEVCRPTST